MLKMMKDGPALPDAPHDADHDRPDTRLDHTARRPMSAVDELIETV